MGKTLIIVESPTKAKTISKYLGSSYVVMSSMGHVRDLPKSTLGVDVEDGFEPRYITIRGKGNIIKSLKDEAKKADRVLLASDPDREGEMIAYHLKGYLQNVSDKCRVEFHEITKDTIKKAVKTPRALDMDRIYAQQARRVLDRLVGYKLSPLLWVKVKKGLSAGRVQSVAVRMICDREDEINAFIPEEYWTLEVDLQTDEGLLATQLVRIGDAKAHIPDEATMQGITADLEGQTYTISSISKKSRTRNPVAPFTTSSMQQEAYRKYGILTKKTMQLAQQLYEGIDIGKEGVVGLISYMRTDSTRISPEAQKVARDYIVDNYGADYVPDEPRVYHGKGKIQDAHEAIRPTDIARRPADVKPFLSAQQYKLYKLIWERFLASQMASAIIDTTTVDIAAGKYTFRATGSEIRFPGFMQIYIESRDDEGEKDELGLLPSLQEGQTLPAAGMEPKQHFTTPPPRYTEAMLVKTLEEKGVGRPSTYAPIVDTILGRGYVVREDKHFYSTELGSVVVNLLKDGFPDIIDIDFTAGMEANLDEVEEGKRDWRQIVSDFYGPFAKELKKAEEELDKVSLTPEYSGDTCELCGQPMVYKLGRYGKFLACSGFPECRNTKAIVINAGVKCLACGGDIIQRKSRGGRTFYGCSNYPECKYVSWDKPIEEKCQECGTQMSEKVFRNGQRVVLCPNQTCPTNKKAGKEREQTADAVMQKAARAAAKKTGAKAGAATKGKRKK
ncbi:MAG: type I DNA topoisomerase [Firmicutes bacterium]|nr:type I DNA topoisomerase [Bacillota bacterium]